jgi:hypothetical protein
MKTMKELINYGFTKEEAKQIQEIERILSNDTKWYVAQTIVYDHIEKFGLTSRDEIKIELNKVNEQRKSMKQSTEEDKIIKYWYCDNCDQTLYSVTGLQIAEHRAECVTEVKSMKQITKEVTKEEVVKFGRFCSKCNDFVNPIIVSEYLFCPKHIVNTKPEVLR